MIMLSKLYNSILGTMAYLKQFIQAFSGIFRDIQQYSAMLRDTEAYSGIIEAYVAIIRHIPNSA